MHLFKRSRVVIGAAALLFGASVALADDSAPFPECTRAPSPDDVEAAKQSHIIATSRFNLQDWDKAIEFWRQAYSFDCTAHAILVNIANSYEKKGDKKNAILMLETYLVRAPGAPDMVKVNERVLDMKKSLEPAPTATAVVTATATAAPTATATVAPPTGPRPFGSIPLVVAGVGGALAIAGAIMIPVGLGPYNEALEKCPPAPTQCDPALANPGNTGRVTWNLGGAFLGIGAAAAVGGLGWHFLFNKPAATSSATPAPKARVDVVPVVSPQFGGLLLNGKF